MTIQSRIRRAQALAEGYPTVTIDFVKRELGRAHYGPARLVRYIQLLVDECHFPPPLPDMVGGALVHSVTGKSVWRREPVEAWIDEFLPPANAAAIDARAMRDAAAEMDAAAGSLRLVSERR